jgi:putative protease
VIVQDRGLLRAINERMDIAVHASTQIGIHTPEGVRWAEENGIDRVILARELSLAEISKIRASSKVGLEVFVHGALCYCFSGQCLFSSFAGGRREIGDL